MARQIFLRSVLSSVMLAIVFVGLSGCNPTVQEKEETKSEPGTTVEKTGTVEEPKEKEKAEEPSADDTTTKSIEANQSSLSTSGELKKVLKEWEDVWFLGKTQNAEAATPNAPYAMNAEDANEASRPKLTEDDVIEVIKEPKVNLGKPLVKNLDQFVPLQPNKAAWVNKKGKQVVMVGQVVQRNAPLEMFVCQKHTKEHESVLMVDVDAIVVHAALLLIGAEAGHPVKYDPEYHAATGTPIEIKVIWKDAKGKIQKAKAQDWIKNVKTGKAMKHDWVFAGSAFWENKETGERIYLARDGEFICVSNFPNAMLDLPIKSSDAREAMMFQAWKERIPPLNTPVTIVLTPKVKKVEKKQKPLKPTQKK